MMSISRVTIGWMFFVLTVACNAQEKRQSFESVGLNYYSPKIISSLLPTALEGAEKFSEDSAEKKKYILFFYEGYLKGLEGALKSGSWNVWGSPEQKGFESGFKYFHICLERDNQQFDLKDFGYEFKKVSGWYTWGCEYEEFCTDEPSECWEFVFNDRVLKSFIDDYGNLFSDTVDPSLKQSNTGWMLAFQRAVTEKFYGEASRVVGLFEGEVECTVEGFLCSEKINSISGDKRYDNRFIVTELIEVKPVLRQPDIPEVEIFIE